MENSFCSQGRCSYSATCKCVHQYVCKVHVHATHQFLCHTFSFLQSFSVSSSPAVCCTPVFRGPEVELHPDQACKTWYITGRCSLFILASLQINSHLRQYTLQLGMLNLLLLYQAAYAFTYIYVAINYFVSCTGVLILILPLWSRRERRY